jgi:hypothetical protein
MCPYGLIEIELFLRTEVDDIAYDSELDRIVQGTDKRGVDTECHFGGKYFSLGHGVGNPCQLRDLPVSLFSDLRRSMCKIAPYKDLCRTV